MVAGLASLWGSTALAADFYVDPARGDPSGDGSRARPWARLADVIAFGHVRTQRFATRPWVERAGLEPANPAGEVGPGDSIWLASGNHGAVQIREAQNLAEILVAALPGHRPELERLTVVSASKWRFRGLTISPSFGTTPYEGAIVQVLSHSFTGPSGLVTLEDSRVFSIADASSWDVLDWETEPQTGFDSDGGRITVSNSRFDNVFHGIMIRGAMSTAIHNEIDGFGGDGIRVLGDDSVVELNYIHNAFGGTDPSVHNHDDGIQSWSVGADRRAGTGVVTNVSIRRNLIIHLDDPASPVRGSYFQGIGNFDGFYDRFQISNNVVVADASHGITLTGARDCVVVNNTILSTDVGATELPRNGVPSIQIRNHKDGTASTGNTVQNNIAHGYRVVPNSTEDHNLVVAFRSSEHLALFVDASAHSLQLRPGTRAVDTASAMGAPAGDILGRPRPQGPGVDHGAYEYGTGPIPDPRAPGLLPTGGEPEPVDGGAVDARPVDGGPVPLVDARVFDVGTPVDAQMNDAGAIIPNVDASTPVDAGTGDARVVDDGPRVTALQDTSGACGCRTTSANRSGIWGLALGVLALAARRRTTNHSSGQF